MSVADDFAATALKLSTLTRKTIARLTPDLDQADLRAAAVALRREARGSKLGRRLRRKGALGMAGAF